MVKEGLVCLSCQPLSVAGVGKGCILIQVVVSSYAAAQMNIRGLMGFLRHQCLGAAVYERNIQKYDIVLYSFLADFLLQNIRLANEERTSVRTCP